MIQLRLDRTRPGDVDGPPVGAWALVENRQCSNRVLSGAACETYAVHVAQGTLELRAVGVTRDVIDRVVLSIPL